MTKMYEKNNVRVQVTSYIVAWCCWRFVRLADDVVKHVSFAIVTQIIVAVPKYCIYIANNCVITMLSAVLRRVSRPVVMRTGMCIV
jgi:hypothetical protein